LEDAVWEVVYRLRLQGPHAAAAAAAGGGGPDMGRLLGVMHAVGSLLGPGHGAMLFVRLLHTGERGSPTVGRGFDMQAWICILCNTVLSKANLALSAGPEATKCWQLLQPKGMTWLRAILKDHV
jgi:hypothetical protein